MSRRKQLSGVGVAVAITASIAIGAVARGDGENRAADQPSTASSGERETLSGLRTARGDEDQLPPSALRQIREEGPQTAEPGKAREALVHDPWRVFLTPADDAVCLSLTDSSGGSSTNCLGRADIATGVGAPSAVLSGCEGVPPPMGKGPVCDQVSLYGFVPDGVERVTANVANGSGPSVEVHNNVYVLEVAAAQKPMSVSYSDGKTRVEQPAEYSG